MVTLFLFALLFLQQQPARPASASIDGFVVRAGTNEPVAKAQVALRRVDARGEELTATTNSGGRFSFSSVPPGRYRMAATRNGYVRQEFGQRTLNGRGLEISVAAGQQIQNAVVWITPAATITGRVYDNDGEPLAGVNVQAYRYTFEQGRKVLNPVQQSVTNDLGEYRLYWLTPGQYYVSATYGRGAGRRGSPNQAAGGEGFVPIFYPRTLDAESASPLALTPGALFNGIDFTLEPISTVVVRGTVIDSSGQNLNAAVTLMPRRDTSPAGNMMLRGQVQQGGAFEIRNVPPGSYEIMAMAGGRGGRGGGGGRAAAMATRLTARASLEVGETDVNNVSLVLAPGFTVSGRVALDNLANPADQNLLQRVRILLLPEMDIRGGFGLNSEANINPDGTFTMAGVAPGNYRLRVNGNGAFYVKSARLGGADLLNDVLRLERPPAGPIDIMLGTRTATLSGTVLDERRNPALNMTVVLVPAPGQRERWDLYRSVNSDSTGRFTFTNVVPGDYKVFAWDGIEGNAYHDPEFLQRYEDKGTAVRLGEGSASTVELTVIPFVN